MKWIRIYREPKWITLFIGKDPHPRYAIDISWRKNSKYICIERQDSVELDIWTTLFKIGRSRNDY